MKEVSWCTASGSIINVSDDQTFQQIWRMRFIDYHFITTAIILFRNRVYTDIGPAPAPVESDRQAPEVEL